MRVVYPTGGTSNWRARPLQVPATPGWCLICPVTGRFWSLLAEQPERVILAADNSPHMLEVARRCQPEELVSRVKMFQTSAFAIDLDDGAVDCVFSMRLLHHIAEPEHRLAMLPGVSPGDARHIDRICRWMVITKPGNAAVWKLRRALRGPGENQNRFIVSADVVGRFAAAGFKVLASRDFLPRYAMWRVYTLQSLIFTGRQDVVRD